MNECVTEHMGAMANPGLGKFLEGRVSQLGPGGWSESANEMEERVLLAEVSAQAKARSRDTTCSYKAQSHPARLEGIG